MCIDRRGFMQVAAGAAGVAAIAARRAAAEEPLVPDAVEKLRPMLARLDGHEWTYLVRGNETPLEPGMCFSNEPGIYVYGELGVRLEDCFHVTEDGGELFTPQSPSIDDPFGENA